MIPGALDPDSDPLAQARHPLAEEEAEVAHPGACGDVEGQLRHGRGECGSPALPGIASGSKESTVFSLRYGAGTAIRASDARRSGARVSRSPGTTRSGSSEPGQAVADSTLRGSVAGQARARRPGWPPRLSVLPPTRARRPSRRRCCRRRARRGARRARIASHARRSGSTGSPLRSGRTSSRGRGRPPNRAGRSPPSWRSRGRPPAREQAADHVDPPHAGRAGRLARDQRAGIQDQGRSRDGDLGRAAGEVERRPGSPAHEGPLQPDPRRPIGRGVGRGRPEERERPPGRVEDRDRAVAERQVGPLAEEERRAVEGEVGDVHDQVEPVEDEPLPVEDEDRREPPPLEEVDLRFRDPDDRSIPRAARIRATRRRIAGRLEEGPSSAISTVPPFTSNARRRAAPCRGRRAPDAADGDEGAVEAVGNPADPVGDEPPSTSGP